MRRKATRVAAGEMELLSMLWTEGPLTLREAHIAFGTYGRPIGYPTIQTRLNRMVKKKLVERTGERPASYSAVVSRDQVTTGHLRQIVAKLSQGDVVPLVANLLKEQTLTAEQIAELQDLLVRARKKSESRSKKRRQS